MSDNDNEQQQESQQQDNQQQEGGGESTAKKQTRKIENPDSIPTAGGKTIGEDHKGESKMLADNARSESVVSAGNADEIQRELEGKKASNRPQGGEEEKPGMIEKAKGALGLGKKE